MKKKKFYVCRTLLAELISFEPNTATLLQPMSARWLAFIISQRF